MNSCADCGVAGSDYESTYSFGRLPFCSAACQKNYGAKNATLLERGGELKKWKERRGGGGGALNALVVRVLDDVHLEVFYPATFTLDTVRLRGSPSKLCWLVGDARERQERVHLMREHFLAPQEYCKGGSPIAGSDDRWGAPLCPKKLATFERNTAASSRSSTMQMLERLPRKENPFLTALFAPDQQSLRAELSAARNGLIVFLPTNTLPSLSLLCSYFLPGMAKVEFKQPAVAVARTTAQPDRTMKLLHVLDATTGISRNHVELWDGTRHLVEQMGTFTSDGAIFIISPVSPPAAAAAAATTTTTTTPFLLVLGQGTVSIGEEDHAACEFLRGANSVSLVDAFTALSPNQLVHVNDFITTQWMQRHLVSAPVSSFLCTDGSQAPAPVERLAERKFFSPPLQPYIAAHILPLSSRIPFSPAAWNQLQFRVLQSGNPCLTAQCAWAAQFAS